LFRPFLEDGSYDELLEDTNVDIVYVGNLHSFRRTIGEKVLKAGKNCLLEKPFACNAADAEYLIGLAKERNLFLMEVRFLFSFLDLSIRRDFNFENFVQWLLEGDVDTFFPSC
jgi:hypothetical protein